MKFRALRLDHGSYSWGTENISRKTRVMDVVYNASNNELVRTKSLVKNAVVVVDATPFKAWYRAHYGVEIGKKKKQAAAAAAAAPVVEKKIEARIGHAKRPSSRSSGRPRTRRHVQFWKASRVYIVTSRPIRAM